MSAADLLLAFVAAALKAGLLLALAAALVLLLKRAPARARHGIWAGALAGALLVPVLSPWLPAWSIAALPVPAGAVEKLILAPARAVPPPIPAPAGAVDPLIPEPAGAIAPRFSDPAAAAGRRGGATSAALASELSTRAGSTRAGSAPAASTRVAAVSPAAWLLWLWLAGCLASCAGLVRALGAARGLERDAVVVSAPWRDALAQARRRVGVRREVKLLRSPAVATPMTWGLLRPVILLPAGAASWSAERRRIVLLHELVHVRRADWLMRLLGRLACSIYWPNPLAWIAARRLAAEQEIACDEEVVALGTRPSCYARHLLAIARSLAPAGGSAARAPAHALDMARRSQMEGRLMSILDGSARPRGGRKLAILALLLIAGLVPALAAIEPWVEEQEYPAPSPSGPPSASISSADTAGVARILGELEALERQMEPFAAELEGVQMEMEPIERELEGIEVEIEPVEVELEGFDSELEPFEAMTAAIEAEMELHQARLEAIAAELEPFEKTLEDVEAEMGPFEEQLEAVEAEIQPFERRLEQIEAEMEPLHEELEQLSGRMELVGREPGSAEAERLAALMGELQQRLEPLHERMGAAHEEMEPVFERMSEAHRGMEPLHERMGAIHEQMEPVFERMAAVHQELEPLHEHLAQIHEQMEPVYERLSAAHARLAPIHERVGEHHQRLEPHHRKMGEIHERMEPLHEEMGRRHEELERELEGVVERLLARQLAGVTAAGTDYVPAAARIVDEVSLRVDNGTLRVMSSAPRLREILAETLGGQSTVSEGELAAAVERVVRAIGELEVEAR